MIHPPPELPRQPEPLVPGMPTDVRRWAGEVVQIVVLTAVMYLLLSTFVGQPFEVEQRSMEPTLAGGDHILIDRLTPRWTGYERGDVVVFDPPDGHVVDSDVPYVKRIIGLPGETVLIENGRIYVAVGGGPPTRLDEPYVDPGDITVPQGAAGRWEWTVPDGAYFVLGDNRSDSVDSRTFGPIDSDEIVGRAVIRYLPLDRIGVLGAEGDQPADPGGA